MTTTREQALTEVNNMMMEAVEYCKLHSICLVASYDIGNGDAKLVANTTPMFLAAHALSINRSLGMIDEQPRLSYFARIMYALSALWSSIFTPSKLPK